MKTYILILLLIFGGSKKVELNFQPTVDGSEIILHHKYYTVAYDCRHHITNWVYSHLTTKEIVHNVDRKNNFISDPLLNQCDNTSADYNGTGFDRGHLSSAEDNAFDKLAMDECFYMTNMAAQDPSFNRGVWKKLETQVREWVKTRGELFVVSGSIIGSSTQTIGVDKIAVPEYCYKALLDYKHKQAIAFVLKNRGSDTPLGAFVISVDSLEKMTATDFFPALTDSVENRIEKTNNATQWFK